MIVSQTKAGKLIRKRFEFVIQGIQESTVEIPSQTFIYYDVEQSSYTQKSTNPLTLTILPGAVPDVSAASDNALEKTPPAQAVELGPINTKGPWNATLARTALPWWLFILLIFLPGIALGVIFVWQLLYRWYVHYARYRYALNVRTSN